ncbi:oxygen-independent coproporphyrinogen III oxidase [Helicobacter cappadocius]|uniref:Coproporphyrinogen-III oxidase n=1 Tax=Helicobacter cappadocius TaxID=3063998 RepID=A0AA90T4F1_9HELI|nr:MULTISPECIES: oxygen-independent coproporphyrinogen III oxidase [unclassified Helicobacter]MDO7252371.1 oxygen-independent coproporphyrinogen III oxidase [Helicobacter sp. faydin-H75]MDP2538238.1 oxygen-independent coproporphyrinogen III oxidase [Helicobacter sp. faydin-H76]
MIDFKKFVKYSKSAPRYTSYPTAVEFVPSFDDKALKDSFIRNDNIDAYSQHKLPLSLYVHLPFCRSACYFCGCNVIYTSKEEKKDRYIGYLKKELEILKKYMNTNREVVQFHFGGGTPTFFDARQLKEVIDLVKNTFPNFSKNAEVSCEIDPRHFSEDQMEVLKNSGFNRLSFGVQDFDDKVQEAVHRKQSVDFVSRAVDIARSFGISSINFDLIYGLPLQTYESFEETLQKVVDLSPDRLAVFNYAHVPWMKKTMRKIDETTLPTPDEKLRILEHTIAFLEKMGYKMIGMDHFAKTTDELYKASIEGELRRNFQGYTTRGFSQTIGIGLTSIGEGKDYYTQNYKDMESYEKAIDNGVLPVERGIRLSNEDILRKEVIMGLMNNLKLDFKTIEEKFHINFTDYFKAELQELSEYVQSDLLNITKEGIYTTPTGGMLIRNIAMVFDEYLQKIPATQRRFSKSV